MKIVARTSLALAAGALFFASGVQAQVGANQGLLNPNLATADELAGVPGLYTDVVRAIMDQRPFMKMADLHRIIGSHLAEDEFDAAYGAMWIPIDLNDATDAEIQLIPGVGARMLHEFREYAPYPALVKFDREIAKYVDDDELARLTQYVYVRIDLNTASESAMLSIPGVGDRMKHEFEEYRPYSAMAQFKREMAKYVDDDEVERLSRYVEIR